MSPIGEEITAALEIRREVETFVSLLLNAPSPGADEALGRRWDPAGIELTEP